MGDACEEKSYPEPMDIARENLLTDMAVAFLGGELDDGDPYNAWEAMGEEGREALRARVRPLLPFAEGRGQRWQRTSDPPRPTT